MGIFCVMYVACVVCVVRYVCCVYGVCVCYGVCGMYGGVCAMVCMVCMCDVYGMCLVHVCVCGTGCVVCGVAAERPQCSSGQPSISWQGEGLPTYSLPCLHPSRMTDPEKPLNRLMRSSPTPGQGNGAC